MRIALGSDHAGVKLKAEVKQVLDELNVAYKDFGTASEASVDYPDYAFQAAAAVAAGNFDRGILICGTGVGMVIAANKIHGVRAAQVIDPEGARLSREHNDANILALGARLTSRGPTREIVKTFLNTSFAGGRHKRRVDKIIALENSNSR